MAILAGIGEKIGESIARLDVEICHHVPTRKPGVSNIVVQFQRRQKQDAVLGKARGKVISTSDVGFPSSTPAYLNEHLCPTLKILMGITVATKYGFRWKCVDPEWENICTEI